MNEYILGIDTGSTKSHLAIFDIDGNLVAFDRWGPLSHEGIPGTFALFEEEFGRFVHGALSKAKISMKQIVYSVMGLTGCDTKKQYKTLCEIAKRIGFENFTLSNDAYLGIPAGNPNGVGICGINGTGCSLAGINQKGDMLQIGGVGFISSDLGGGGIMGRKVVSSVYNEIFRKGPSTLMTPLLFQKLGISSKYDFVDTMCDRIDDNSYNKFNCVEMLFEAAMENDKVAMNILSTIAESYANGISCLIDELQFDIKEELCIVMAGSVFVKGKHPVQIDTIKEIISKNHPEYKIKYVKLEVPPVTGAVVWAFNMLGKTGYFNKIQSQLFSIE